VDWVNEGVNIPVEDVEVSSVCGAGDSSLAGFVTEYLKSKNIKKSLDFANRVARVAVSKSGVVAVELETVFKR
jgi:fructose-1-phosphate kinase PfkB-like protein